MRQGELSLFPCVWTEPICALAPHMGYPLHANLTAIAPLQHPTRLHPCKRHEWAWGTANRPFCLEKKREIIRTRRLAAQNT